MIRSADNPGWQLRRHRADAVQSLAVYSDCGAYRYGLARRWGAGDLLLYVMLNPSTATELANDPTIERCERRARMLGYAGLGVVNLFAYRATQPRDLKRAGDSVGPLNDRAIGLAAARVGAVLCAWGNHGIHQGRAAEVINLLRETGRPLLHLGLTGIGTPRHPLYVAYAEKPQAWIA